MSANGQHKVHCQEREAHLHIHHISASIVRDCRLHRLRTDIAIWDQIVRHPEVPGVVFGAVVWAERWDAQVPREDRKYWATVKSRSTSTNEQSEQALVGSRLVAEG
jgi:hypothetical protein